MGARERLGQRNALDTVQAGFQQFIGPVFNPAGGGGVRRPAVGRIVLEAAVLRRIVRGGDDNAVGQSGFPPAIPSQDRVGDDRGRSVFIALGDHDLDAICRQHLQRGGAGRDGKGVGVNAQKERAVGSLAFSIKADGLGDGQDVVFVERPVEGRAAMAGSAKRHPLRRDRGIGRPCIVGRDEPGHVDQPAGSAGFPARGLILMALLLR